MIWSHRYNREITLIEFASLLLAEIEELRKELKMDFTNLDSAITKLAGDVKTEVDAAVAAITAAQANPADVQHLADAVNSLQAIDAAVTAAKDQFTPTSTNTTT